MGWFAMSTPGSDHASSRLKDLCTGWALGHTSPCHLMVGYYLGHPPLPPISVPHTCPWGKEMQNVTIE